DGARRARDALLIEQIRGAVQGDDRLARTGGALHGHDVGAVADDVVLLGLDALHDLPHLAGRMLAQEADQDVVRGGASLSLAPEVLVSLELPICDREGAVQTNLAGEQAGRTGESR